MKTVKIIAAFCAGLCRIVCLSLQGLFLSNIGSMPQSLVITDVIRSEYNRAKRKLYVEQSLSWLYAPCKIEPLKLQ